MFSRDSAKSNFRFRNILDLMKYKKAFYDEHSTYFEPDGLICFIGAQGKGKTLSAVKYVSELMRIYPQAKLVTNLMLRDFPIVTIEEFIKKNYCKNAYINFNELTGEMQRNLLLDYVTINRVFPFNNAEDLRNYSNLDEGVIFLIDEIQLYFNSLESKNINMDVMAQISQQRKQRKHIVCTSQLFGRLAKPLREQFNTVVVCNNYLGIFQLNEFVSADSSEKDNDSAHISGKVVHKQFFIHSPKDYGAYDTYYIIDRNKFVSNEDKKGDIYDIGDNERGN